MKIVKLDQVWSKATGDPDEERDLADHLTFFAPNYRFHPKFKAGYWDGKIKLYNRNTKLLYQGLHDQVEKFCKDSDYDLEKVGFVKHDVTLDEAAEFAATLGTPFPPRDYQIDAFRHCVSNEGGLVLMPTGAGKSFTIYMLVRFYEGKHLIVVPRINLIHQFESDIRDYGFKGKIHCILDGDKEVADADIVIGCWQTLSKVSKAFLGQFSTVLVDEVHTATAAVVKGMMEKIPVAIRFGFTATLDGTKASAHLLEGMFGPVWREVTTKDLQDMGHLSQMKLRCVLFEYSQEEREFFKKNFPTYDMEMEYICKHKERNKTILSYAARMEGISMVLFHYEDHGLELYEQMKTMTNRPVYFINGKIKGKKREEIRQALLKGDGILVGSRETVSFGINIPGMANIFLVSPSKARIKLLQAIGRGLRLHREKDCLNVLDFADDLSWKKRKNYTLTHFMERMRIYSSENHTFKIHKVQL